MDDSELNLVKGREQRRLSFPREDDQGRHRPFCRRRRRVQARPRIGCIGANQVLIWILVQFQVSYKRTRVECTLPSHCHLVFVGRQYYCYNSIYRFLAILSLSLSMVRSCFLAWLLWVSKVRMSGNGLHNNATKFIVSLNYFANSFNITVIYGNSFNIRYTVSPS